MKFLAVFFIISFSVHAEDYFMTRKWSDNLGEHTLFFEKKHQFIKIKRV
ncbi:hypothetical protein ROS60_004225 [Pluralibacter gergoviae]|nr:hypothetical protein [Pluralibacter gergoviae]ELK5594966.1 hypothetical protein [Pluralibacter gergoviae]MDU4435933.1 hypothetical protein [Pluralibacter gergoviae]HDS1081629.1 hypothetical protein [Pluralibacter gergoviae]